MANCGVFRRSTHEEAVLFKKHTIVIDDLSVACWIENSSKSRNNKAALLVCTAMVVGLLSSLRLFYIGEILTCEKTLRWLQVKTAEWLVGCQPTHSGG